MNRANYAILPKGQSPQKLGLGRKKNDDAIVVTETKNQSPDNQQDNKDDENSNNNEENKSKNESSKEDENNDDNENNDNDENNNDNENNKKNESADDKKEIIDIDFGTTLVPLSKVTADNGQAARK